jgi:hypothetical protein
MNLFSRFFFWVPPNLFPLCCWSFVLLLVFLSGVFGRDWVLA